MYNSHIDTSEIEYSQRIRRPIVLGIVIILTIITFAVLASPTFAAGSVQIEGSGYFAGPGECTDDVVGPAGQAADGAIVLTGDLEGCQYIFIETFNCNSGGVYHETGTEYFVIEGGEFGAGTFATTYKFQGKFEGCSEDGFPTGAQVHGRCQHPLIDDSGTGAFEDATGRLDFKDDVDTGTVDYRGHLRW